MSGTNPNKGFGWAFWATVITIISLVLAVGYGAYMVRKAHAFPSEPPVQEIVDWQPDTVGVVIEYEVGGLVIYFFHPQLPTEQGAVVDEYEDPFISEGILYLTVKGTNLQYQLVADPSMFRWAHEQDWTGLYERTWPCGCE